MVIRLPRISNYDDFDPLEESGCRISYVSNSTELGNPDLIIIPGTKSTIADLQYLQQEGLAEAIIRLAHNGTPVIGICGGYQMLGKIIRDPSGVESKQENSQGLGLLDCETVFEPVKTTIQVKACVTTNHGLFKNLEGTAVTGYEIHMGQTKRLQHDSCFQIAETPEGKTEYFDGDVNSNGLVFGTYLHGLFHNKDFTRVLLNNLKEIRGIKDTTTEVTPRDKQYDNLAAVVGQNLDMEKVYSIIFGKTG